jgi:thioredoxin 1
MINSVDEIIKNFSNKRLVLNFSEKEYESSVRCNLHDFFEVSDPNTFIVLENLKEILRTNSYDETTCKLRVIDFYAEWCSPCRKIAPEFDSLKESYPNIQFDKINVDNGDPLIERCEISSIPAFVVFDGEEILFKSQDIKKLKQFLDSKVPAKSSVDSLDKDLSVLELV